MGLYSRDQGVSNGRLKLDEMVTHQRPLDEVNEAFEDLAAGRVARTVLIP